MNFSLGFGDIGRLQGRNSFCHIAFIILHEFFDDIVILLMDVPHLFHAQSKKKHPQVCLTRVGPECRSRFEVDLVENTYSKKFFVVTSAFRETNECG